MGPRIYNLFPSLCGPIVAWHEHLPRIARMNFDWLFLNPFHYPGFSGSLYAVKDYYRLNPLFRGRARKDDHALVAEFVAAARKHGLAVMMDLVINHTAKDSVLVERHPEWFAREPDGSIRSPHAVDPADTTRRTVWGDLAEIDYDSAAVRSQMVAYWSEVVRHYLRLGVTGFRCDAAYKVPAEVWAPLIAEARRTTPEAEFHAETLGCQVEQVEALAGAGFDYLFNSVKWWDLEADWALAQYEIFRRIAPSIGFPESHDTARLATELPAGIAAEDARRHYLLRYALAACFSTGVLMPIGFEFGFRRPLDVVRTRPAQWEAPQFDISPEIAEINEMRAACPALNEEGPQRRLSGGGGCLALVRQTNDGTAASVFLANPSSTETVTADVQAMTSGAKTAENRFREVAPAPSSDPRNLTFRLQPLEWRVLQTA